MQNANLKDFSRNNDGEIIAISSDPWITVDLETEYPLITIEIDAMNVQDFFWGGRIQIFNTDTWKVKGGILRDGNNFYCFRNIEIQKP